MNKHNLLRLSALIVVLAAAVFYPLKKILFFEYPKFPPQEFRFRTDAVDPYDPFRGKFVTLRPLPDSVKAEKKDVNEYRKYKYAVLGRDKDGFAVVLRLTEEKPKKTSFVRIRYTYTGPEWLGNKQSEESYHRFQFPFDRFYMNERLAPEAEKLVASLTRENKDSCVLVVNVYENGAYAVKDLLIKGKPIRELLREKGK